MNNALLLDAQRLAARPYQIEIECEDGELHADIPRYTACIREMPFCVAQGFTEEEARLEIRSVLVDYILSLLIRNLSVPEPEIQPSDKALDTVSNDRSTIASSARTPPI